MAIYYKTAARDAWRDSLFMLAALAAIMLIMLEADENLFVNLLKSMPSSAYGRSTAENPGADAMNWLGQGLSAVPCMRQIAAWLRTFRRLARLISCFA